MKSNESLWDKEGQLRSSYFDDIYFSSADGLQETRYVFLEKNNLEKRFSSLNEHQTFIIAETGFGTGLNFLACCYLWKKTAPASAKLHFISTEKFPLDKKVIEKALLPWPELEKGCKQLLEKYPTPTSGSHRCFFENNICLSLLIGDANQGLQSLLASLHPDYSKPLWQGVDAWFLDGFAPAKNPEMWTQELFNTIASLSHKNTTLATFTAAGAVRRGLTQAGFTIKKVSGFGSKREMCVGQFNSSSTLKTKTDSLPKQERAPWPVIENYSSLSRNKTITVIGGGLAGCHTAQALARQGYQVHLFESQKELAQGASGNQQGVVYGKLSHANDVLSEFNCQALSYCLSYYQEFWQQQTMTAGESCGMLQLALNEKEVQLAQKISQRFHAFPEFVRYVNKQEASALANTKLEYPGLYFTQAGWINPRLLCYWLVDHPNIHCHFEMKVTSLKQADSSQNSQWEITVENKSAFSTDAVVITNAYDALQLQQTSDLPIKHIRGQVTHYPVTTQSSQLKTVICGEGYIAPAENQHCLGATFNLQETSSKLSGKDHLENLQKLHQQAPHLIDTTLLQASPNSPIIQNLEGRVGFRTVTPDYLPIAGAVPIKDELLARFADLAFDAKRRINQVGPYHSHLYINIGHGSRGLAYTPICAEVIASLISGSPPPLPRELLRALNPSRFFIRQLIRGL